MDMPVTWIFIAIATAFCTVWLVTRKDEKGFIPLQVAWILTAVIHGIIDCTVNPENWDKTTVTHWAVQGKVVSNPERNLIFYAIASVAVILIISYIAARILNAMIRSVLAPFFRSSLPGGEKRKVGLPFRPVCYCCNERKSFFNDFPSRICGQRICFDCLKALDFDSLPTSKKLAAYGHKAPYTSADDVIAELKQRKGLAPDAPIPGVEEKTDGK